MLLLLEQQLFLFCFQDPEADSLFLGYEESALFQGKCIL